MKGWTKKKPNNSIFSIDNTTTPEYTIKNENFHLNVQYLFHHEKLGKSKHPRPFACDPAFMKNRCFETISMKYPKKYDLIELK